MPFAIIRYIAASILSVFDLILLIYCIAGFVIRDPFNKFMQALGVIVDPVLQPLRWLLDHISFLRTFPIDFSPLLAFMIIALIRSLL